MDRMILGHGRRHEPSRRINHVRGIILAAAISRGQHYASATLELAGKWAGASGSEGRL
jgi:hypothetical protein